MYFQVVEILSGTSSTTMSWTWFQNLIGVSLSEFQMRDIPHPHLELTVHVTFKCVEAFGLLGMCVVGPISALSRPSARDLTGVKNSALKCGKWGVLLGTVAGPAMTYLRLKSSNATEASVYDRCYRLRYNRNQVRVDRGALAGAVAGSALAVPAGASPMVGALLGMSAGLLSMGFYNNKK